MKLTYKRMVLMEWFDRLFQAGALAIPVLWAAQAVATILSNGFFSYVQLPLYPLPLATPLMHSLTVLAVVSFYLYTFWTLNYLVTEVRVPVAVGYAALTFLFYDLVWILCEYLTTGQGVLWVQLVPVLGTCIPLTYYARKYSFVKIQKWFLVLASTFALLMVLLSLSGFYQQCHIYHSGGGPNPHGWMWFAGKLVGVWMWSGTYKQRGGLE